MTKKSPIYQYAEKILQYIGKIILRLLFALLFLAYGSIFYCIFYYVLSWFAPRLLTTASQLNEQYIGSVILFFLVLTLLAYLATLYSFPWTGRAIPKKVKKGREKGSEDSDPKSDSGRSNGPLQITAKESKESPGLQGKESPNRRDNV